MNPSRVVLITGCSSGIGKSTALHLQKAGWTVYATARKVKDLEALQAAGCRTLALDVCSEESMVAAVAAIEAEHGAVGVLINNAGYSQSGALEALPMERVRAQFETNVFGMIRLCQLVLPGMRRQKWGKIVNVSSMGGKLTFPGGGAYHASKHAVEALSDALRFEVKAFGVNVIVIQPGLIKTGFAEAVATGMNFPDKIPEYAEFHKKVSQATKDVYEKGPLAPLGGVPEDVAKAIEKAINAKRPRARYPVTWSADVLLAQRRWMSDAMWDFFLTQNFPAPGV